MKFSPPEGTPDQFPKMETIFIAPEGSLITRLPDRDTYCVETPKGVIYEVKIIGSRDLDMDGLLKSAGVTLPI